jgi:hypothetical protein
MKKLKQKQAKFKFSFLVYNEQYLSLQPD